MRASQYVSKRAADVYVLYSDVLPFCVRVQVCVNQLFAVCRYAHVYVCDFEVVVIVYSIAAAVIADAYTFPFPFHFSFFTLVCVS